MRLQEIAGLGEGGKPFPCQGTGLGIGRLQIGDVDGDHTGPEGTADAVDGILKGKAIPGSAANGLAGTQEDLGIGLAAGDLIAGNDCIEKGQETCTGELIPDGGLPAGACHGKADAGVMQGTQDPGSTLLDRHLEDQVLQF